MQCSCEVQGLTRQDADTDQTQISTKIHDSWVSWWHQVAPSRIKSHVGYIVFPLGLQKKCRTHQNWAEAAMSLEKMPDLGTKFGTLKLHDRGSNAKLTQLGATANMSKNSISSPKKYHMHMILNSFQRLIQNKILGASISNTRHDIPFYIPTISPWYAHYISLYRILPIDIVYVYIYIIYVYIYIDIYMYGISWYDQCTCE
jgi:hypothetical protein